jgi:hypothetical protein
VVCTGTNFSFIFHLFTDSVRLWVTPAKIWVLDVVSMKSIVFWMWHRVVWHKFTNLPKVYRLIVEAVGFLQKLAHLCRTTCHYTYLPEDGAPRCCICTWQIHKKQSFINSCRSYTVNYINTMCCDCGVCCRRPGLRGGRPRRAGRCDPIM